MEELGAGFVLATHDLEIRGAGELLGERPSGQMTEIGMALYPRSARRSRAGAEGWARAGARQAAGCGNRGGAAFPAFLPESFIGDVHVRDWRCTSELPLRSRFRISTELAAEIIDRFSMPPPQAQNLLRIARLKLAARALGVRRLDLGPQGGYVIFEEKNSIDPAAVIRMLRRHHEEYRLGQFSAQLARDPGTAPRQASVGGI